jgi:PAT family beta-lactamase induction signal transducer AmpG
MADAPPPMGPLYADPRMPVLAGLGFASGMPLVLANDTLVAWLTRSGVDVATIGFLSLITLPYALKFLWAPWLDRFSVPGLGLLGRRRSWLVVTQSLIAAALALLAVAGPESASDDLWPVSVIGTAIVLLSASQDIVADAYRADVLSPRHLGAGAAMFVMGYRVAMIVGGAAALILGKRLGWPAAYTVMAVLMGGCVVISLLAPRPPDEFRAPGSMREAVLMPVLQFARSRGLHAIVIVLFVLVFRLPDSLAQRMTLPLLLDHLGFDEAEVGFLRQLLGFLITIIGALCGGALVARFGLLRSLIVFGVLQTLSNAGFLVLTVSEPSRWSMAAVIGVESFCGGLVAAGFVAFLMSCCDRRYSATQYALFTGLMALAATLSGTVSGWMVARLGYTEFFGWTIAAGLPGMLLLPLLDRTPPESLNAA